jgi:hypothetical protein
MRITRAVVVMVLCLVTGAAAQTAEELVAKNLQAKGGVDKIKAINTLKMSGTVYVEFGGGGINAGFSQEDKRQNYIRQGFSLQGMTQTLAYDGSNGWKIDPFQGRKDPEMLGEDEMRDLVDNSDIDGPLVDYQSKGNKVEYVGHDIVDGDDAYKLKVTLKDGDIVYYYLDPDTYLEIKTVLQEFIRGSIRETEQLLGSYKQVNGVYFPYSIEMHQKGGTGPSHFRISFDKIEANVPIEDSFFKMPAAAK